MFGALVPDTPIPQKDGEYAFSVTVDDEQVLAPCEIFTVSKRIPQILEVVENCEVLYSDNPNPKYMKATSEVIEKGTKLFYNYTMKQDLGEEEHRVLYEVPTLGKGKWLADTNKSGQQLLRKMPSDSPQVPPVTFHPEDEFQTKPITANSPFPPLTQKDRQAQIKYKQILSQYARAAADTTNANTEDESGIWPLRMLWTKDAGDDGAVCPLLDAIVDNRYRIVEHMVTTKVWHGWRAVDTLLNCTEVFLKTFRGPHDIHPTFKNWMEMNFAAQKHIDRERKLMHMQTKSSMGGWKRHKNISSVLDVTKKHAPRTISLRQQSTQHATTQTETINSKIHFSVSELCMISRLNPQKLFLTDEPYLDVVAHFFKQLIAAVQWQHEDDRYYLDISSKLWFARDSGGYVLKLPLSGKKGEPYDSVGIATDLKACGRVLYRMTFDNLSTQMAKTYLDLWKQKKFFTSSKKTIKKIAAVPTLKAKVDALMEMLDVLLYDLPPDTSTNDILRMRFLDTKNMSNIEAKATHFIELNMSKRRSPRAHLPEDRTPTATTEYSRLAGKTVVEVKEILDMLVDGYRRQPQAKGFGGDNVQYFSRFFLKKKCGRCTIVIPTVGAAAPTADTSNEKGNPGVVRGAKPCPPPVRKTPSRAYSISSIASASSIESDVIPGLDFDKDGKMDKETVQETQANTIIHMVVEESKEYCDICAKLAVGGISKQSIWLDFKTRWNEIKDKTTAKEQKKQAVGSLVDVIKICRKAFDDPENLDEFEIMDKLAALFAHIENIKKRKTLGEFKNNDPIHKFLAHSNKGFANNFFVFSTPWAFNHNPRTIITSKDNGIVTHLTSELKKSSAIMLTKDRRREMALNKMEDHNIGGKLVDTQTFVERTKRKAKVYSDMQKILQAQSPARKGGKSARKSPKQVHMWQKAVRSMRMIMALKTGLKRSSSGEELKRRQQSTEILKPLETSRFSSSPAALLAGAALITESELLPKEVEEVKPAGGLDTEDES